MSIINRYEPSLAQRPHFLDKISHLFYTEAQNPESAYKNALETLFDKTLVKDLSFFDLILCFFDTKEKG
jgi:hypothetical protein